MQLPQTRTSFQALFYSNQDSVPEDSGEKDLGDLIARFKARGGRIESYEPGQLIKAQGKWHILARMVPQC